MSNIDTSYYSDVTTQDKSYMLPVKPRVRIMDRTGQTLFYDFNAHISGSYTTASYTPISFTTSQIPPNSLKVLHVETELSMNSSGTFTITIEDSDRVIDMSQFGLGNRVQIFAGKTDYTMEGLLDGYCRNFEPHRDAHGTLIYIMSGYGSQILTNERIVDFVKMADRTDLGEFIADSRDTSHQAYALFKSVFTDASVYPLKRPTLLSQGGFTLDGIDPRVNFFLPAISQSHVPASAILDKIAEYAGAVWGIQDNNVFLHYPNMKHSGITIKDVREDIDLANRTSYFTGPWNFVDSMDITNGFANVLFIKGGVMQADVSSTASAGFTTLDNKDIAQRVTPQAARLKNICALLARDGTGGQFQKPFLEGALVADDGGKPAGLKLFDIKMPILEISSQPTPVFSFNIKTSVKDLQVGESYWLIFYAKGSSNSDTIKWYHDNDFISEDRPPSAFRNVMLDKTTEDRIKPGMTDTTGWSVSKTGPVYTHAFFSVVQTMAVCVDTASAAKYGRVEAVLSAPWISDAITLQSYGASLLQFMAKPLRTFNLQTVTIPNNHMFMPSETVTVLDSFSGLNIEAEIQSVKYVFDEADAFGSRTCEMVPIAYVDFMNDLF